MAITYRELEKVISQMSDEHKDDGITVHLVHTDEFMPVYEGVNIVTDDSQDPAYNVLLDPGTLYLTIDF